MVRLEILVSKLLRPELEEVFGWKGIGQHVKGTLQDTYWDFIWIWSEKGIS